VKAMNGAVSHHERELAELRAFAQRNPTLRALLAVLKTLGPRLSVEPDRRAA
jgi:DNA-binding phage protein